MPLAAFGWIRGQAFSLNRRSAEAIDELRGASCLNSLALAFLAGDYARLGRSHEAGIALSDFIEIRRTELAARRFFVERNTVTDLASGYCSMWREPDDWQHIATGLELAGLQK